MNDERPGEGASGEQFDAPTRSIDAPAEIIGANVGPYKLLQLLGEGGMGVVFLAEQREPIHRRVALKIIKPGMDSRQVVARFEAERQALSLMDHPNIAKVLDVGTTDEGRPFFVMELVNGVPITKFCDKQKYSTQQRLELFVTVCHAIQHAHRKGIIHRDLKPSNILVALKDDQPLVKVIDFGLAKATQQKLTEKTLFTALGQMVGTPTYMSPEQADASGLDIDTRTDVYSLGVLLYELLTGQTPLSTKQLQEAGIVEMQRLICEQDAPRMSSRISSVKEKTDSAAKSRATDSKQLVLALRGDLDLIALKALEKDRSRRYESPLSLGADVQRYLDNEPIEARPASVAYRLRKLIRRNRAAFAATVIIAISMIGATVFSSIAAIQAIDALDKEKTANDVATKRLAQLEKANQILASIFKDLDPESEGKGGATLLAQLGERLDEAAALVEGDSIGDPLAVARLKLTIAKAQRRLGSHAKAEKNVGEALSLFEQHLGPQHLETLDAVHAAAATQHSLGDYQQAIDLYDRAIAGRFLKLGDRHADTLVSRSLLAQAYADEGQRKKGLELQKAAFEALEQTRGPLDSLTIDALNRLAAQNYYYNDKQHDLEAERLFQLVVERLTESKGPDHYLTHTALSGLANAKTTLGKHEEAVALMEKNLEGVRKKLGPDHLFTIRSSCELAFTYDEAGQKDKGLAILAENVARLRAKLGDDDPMSMAHMNLLAFTYEQNDQIDEAVKLHGETVQLRAKNLGEDNPETLTSRCNYGWCLRLAGRYPESIEQYAIAVPMLRKRHGAEHAEVVGATNNFAFALYQGGEFERAEPELRQCVPVMQRDFGKNWKTHRAAFWLGDVLLRKDKLDEAEGYLKAACEGFLSREDDLPGEGRKAMVSALERIVQLYEKRNADGDAELAANWKAEHERIAKKPNS